MPGKIRVLVADDIPETRVSIKKILSLEEKIEVAGEAANGSEAVALAVALRPDIILMDINMPGMDGIAATELIARENPGVSVIVLSVQEEQEYISRAMEAGAREYMVKPPGIDELLRAILRVYESTSGLGIAAKSTADNQ
ncbi:MAG: response regulator transcription factor [Bacillota bacterium]